MGEQTGIEWCDHTFNPWIGCTPVSPGCADCYAKRLVERFGGSFSELRRTSLSNYNQLSVWNRKAERAGVRRRVFVASMADFFDNQANPNWRQSVWMLIGTFCPHLDFLILTKRPQNIPKMLPPDWGDGYPNVWLGTSVENQEEADRRIPHLLAVPARVHFLSCEPLLGPIDLTRINGVRPCDPSRPSWIDWVIVGGESGPRARPMHPDWARSLRDQCITRGVPFFFKQWGEWAPNQCEQADYPDPEVRSWAALESGSWQRYTHDELTEHVETPLSDCVARYGKKRAGNLLDGVAHRQFPDA